MRDGQRLEASVEALLEDEAYGGHPLREALADLYAEFKSHLHQLERIARISDHYQIVERETRLTLGERYRKQLRQLEKMARISDQYQLMLRDLNEALKEASTTDELTGIGNRRMLMARLKSEIARAERLARPFTIAIADIDHFKAINDEHGHEAGDEVLVEMAHTIRSALRQYDCCGRWGGEEFLIVMPEIAAPEAAMIIERLRNAISTQDLRLDGRPVELTASFGIAQYSPGDTISHIIHRADTALYAAKRAGRNRYEFAI